MRHAPTPSTIGPSSDGPSSRHPALHQAAVWVVGLALGVLAIRLVAPNLHQLRAAFLAMEHGRWAGIALTLAASAASYCFAAIALTGASPDHLPFGRTVVAEVASSFAGPLLPLGGLGLITRHLHRQGQTTTQATTTVATVALTGFLVHVGLLGVAAAASGLPRKIPLHPSWSTLIVVAVVTGVVAVMVAVSSGLRRRGGAAVSTAWRQLADVVRDPRRAARLFIGSVGITCSYITALVAALDACGVRASIPRIAVVYLIGTAVSSVAPTPGGIGAVEASLLAGLTAIGAPAVGALAGVLTFRLATFWLPILPGWFAAAALRRRQLL